MVVILESEINGREFHIEVDGETKEDIQATVKKMLHNQGIRTQANWKVTVMGKHRREHSKSV